jgi:hypothetical protein
VQLPSLLPVGFAGQGKVGLTLKICGEDSVRSEVAQGGYMCGWRRMYDNKCCCPSRFAEDDCSVKPFDPPRVRSAT